jgi:hypothetical protein
MSVVLSERGLCVGLITRPEESNRIRLSECDFESSTMRRPLPTRGCQAVEKNSSINYQNRMFVKFKFNFRFDINT